MFVKTSIQGLDELLLNFPRKEKDRILRTQEMDVTYIAAAHVGKSTTSWVSFRVADVWQHRAYGLSSEYDRSAVFQC